MSLSFDNVPALNNEVGVKILNKKENVKDGKDILVITVDYDGKNYELGLFGRDCIQKNQSKLYDDNGDLYIKVDESKIKTIDGINWI